MRQDFIIKFQYAQELKCYTLELNILCKTICDAMVWRCWHEFSSSTWSRSGFIASWGKLISFSALTVSIGLCSLWNRPLNYLLCAGWDVKTYSLTHSVDILSVLANWPTESKLHIARPIDVAAVEVFGKLKPNLVLQYLRTHSHIHWNHHHTVTHTHLNRLNYIFKIVQKYTIVKVKVDKYTRTHTWQMWCFLYITNETWCFHPFRNLRI